MKIQLLFFIIFVATCFRSVAQKTDIIEIAQSNNFIWLEDFVALNKDTAVIICSNDSINDALFLTEDGGKTWNFVGSNKFDRDEIKTLFKPNYMFGVFHANDKYIRFSENFGKNVKKITIPGRPYAHIYASDSAWLLSMQVNEKYQLMISKDLGSSWEVQNAEFGGAVVYFSGEKLVFYGGFSDKLKNTHEIWLSNDLGKTFTGHGYKHGNKILTYISIDTAYYVVNDYSDYTITIYWSFDGGKTIHTQYSTSFGSTENVGNIKMANSKIGYRNSGNKLYKTYNGGQTWYYKYTFECPVSNIEVIDQNHVYFHHIGSSAGSNKCIYVTHNGAEPLVETQEEPQKNDFTLYPNPAKQSIILSTPNGANAALSIYNLMGQIQYQNPAQAPGAIDISHLATGLYVFELRQGAVVYRQRIEVVK